MIVEDTAADPALGLSKAKKVIATLKPHFFTGSIASNEYAAMKDVVTHSGAIWLLLTQGAGAEDTVLPICSRNAFGVSWNNWQLSAPFAQWAYDNIAETTVLFLYANYNWGQGAGAVFKEYFEKAGGKILGLSRLLWGQQTMLRICHNWCRRSHRRSSAFSQAATP